MPIPLSVCVPWRGVRVSVDCAPGVLAREGGAVRLTEDNVSETDVRARGGRGAAAGGGR